MRVRRILANRVWARLRKSKCEGLRFDWRCWSLERPSRECTSYAAMKVSVNFVLVRSAHELTSVLLQDTDSRS